MGKAADFYNGIIDLVDERIGRHQSFRATVTAVSGNFVQIQPVGASEPLSEWYATVRPSAALVVGDEVAVMMMSGSPLVIGKIMR